MIFILFLILTLGSCGPGFPAEPELTLKESYNVEFKEPSGLSYFFGGDLITVSDHNGKAYVIDTLGNIKSMIDLKAKDLEGVSYDALDSLLYIVDESDGKLRCFTTRGSLLDSWSILQGDEESGLEGCSLDRKRQVMYLLKEKSPGQLILFDMKTGRQTEMDLDFAKDYSGIYYDDFIDKLWIISHESKSVSLCSLQGQMEHSFRIEAKQAEGIVVDHHSDVIYIMSDSQGKLFKYGLPDF
jgi:uncharacterized protein YjiK